MKGDPTSLTDFSDRRVRRSRSALMRAAVAVVTERGTTDISVSEIAEAADVSRQLLYQHFGDRDTLLLAAAVDLAERELLPQIAADSQIPSGKDRLLAMVHHFAQHRPFYRAMLSNGRAFELVAALNGMFGPFSQRLIDRMSDFGLKP